MADWQLKKARIEITKSTITELGNAHTVRILPDMDGLPGNPLNLPRYGSFFKEVPRLYAHGEIVWVICTQEDNYQIGYILGPAERTGGTPINILITRINEAESKFGLEKSDIRSADIIMATNQFIDYTNKKYGYVGRITTAGAISLFTNDGSVYLSSKGAVIKLLSSGELQQEATVLEQNITTLKEISATHLLNTQGYEEEIGGSKRSKIGVSLTRSIGGAAAKTVAGDETNLCFQKKTETAGIGYTIQVALPLGNINLTSLLGGINFNSIYLNASLGFASSAKGPGPFCAIPFCLFAGVPHTGRTFTGAPLP